MERAGVPRSQAKATTGHKPDSAYDRYAIVSEQGVRSAGERLRRLIRGGKEMELAEGIEPPTL